MRILYRVIKIPPPSYLFKLEKIKLEINNWLVSWTGKSYNERLFKEFPFGKFVGQIVIQGQACSINEVDKFMIRFERIPGMGHSSFRFN